jgi:hypothetical protein
VAKLGAAGEISSVGELIAGEDDTKNPVARKIRRLLRMSLNYQCFEEAAIKNSG